MRSAPGNEAAWRGSRQLQRCCLSGSGFPRPACQAPLRGRKCSDGPKPTRPWGLEAHLVAFGSLLLMVLTCPRHASGQAQGALWGLGSAQWGEKPRGEVAGTGWASDWVFTLVLL